MLNRASSLVFSLATLLFLAIVVYTFREVDILRVLEDVNWPECIGILLLGLAFHMSFGAIMWEGFWLHYKLKLKPIEILTLPLMMHLFLYLMPVKGGMLFQVFYSKRKYGLDLSKSFSLGMLVFIILVLLATFVGLILTYMIPVESTEIRVALWAMAAIIVGMISTLGLVPNYHSEEKGWLKKSMSFLVAVRTQLFEQLKNRKLILGLFSTTLVSVIIQAILFWETGNALGIQSAFLPILLLVLILRVVMLVRILPGNLGLQEIMIATVYAAAGFTVEDGLLIGIITRLISVFWSAVVGLPALYSNLKYFDVQNEGLVQLIRKVGKPRK